MAWARIDDQFADHPKVLAAGPLAAWLYVCGLTYCARLLTDGFIPAGQVRKLADVPNAQKLADTLERVGLWEAVEGGYLVHDFLHYNPSRERTIATREARAEAGSRGGKQRASKMLENSQAVASGSLQTFPKQNRTPYPYPSPSPTPSSFHSEEGGGVPTVREGPVNGHAPARPVGNLVPLPDPFAIDDEMAEWVREQRMPRKWVLNRTESFANQFGDGKVLKSPEEWKNRWRKWLLDDWAKERASGLAAAR